MAYISSLIKSLNLSERINLFYALFTGIYILMFSSAISNPWLLMGYRLLFVVIIFTSTAIGMRYNNRLISLFRYIFPLVLTAYWYPETYFLNNNVLVPNLDAWFDQLDLLMFSCLPAMTFSAYWPQAWVSELMYFGYFSYYLLFAFIALFFYITQRHRSEAILAPVLTSFLLFYLIFMFIPVAGPQFYYSAADSTVPDGYLFSSVMRAIQDMGENPTGAFPSSHVGMTLIFLYVIYRNARIWLYLFLPISIVLFASTVYIKAHYLVDVLGAFVLTPGIYYLAYKINKAMDKSI